MDSTCAEGSFYLAFTNGSHPSNEQLDYDNLPPLFAADGTSVPRDDVDGTSLCDDPCQPISGGGTCRALSCYEVRRRGGGKAGGDGTARMSGAEHQVIDGGRWESLPL